MINETHLKAFGADSTGARTHRSPEADRPLTTAQPPATQAERSPDWNFSSRHIGPREVELAAMLAELGYDSLEALTEAALPKQIQLKKDLPLGAGLSEPAYLAHIAEIAKSNQVFRSHIGMGYSDTITPPVILRNILENPGWYTAYTPYQAEIAQGRLQALLNFQTMVSDLTGLELANASLLDEGTAAAEAMQMCYHLQTGTKRQHFFVHDQCHPQTIEVLQTRARPLGIELIVGDPDHFDFSLPVFAAIVQIPGTSGELYDATNFINRLHEHRARGVVAADLLALTLIKSCSEMGADVAVGTTQRFGVPMGFGGPHAAYFATRAEFRRSIPGRIVGLSIDSQGQPALRLALQTREQHIRREKATSNICTAQVLLAVMAGMYACYHGPEGLRAIAQRVLRLTETLRQGLVRLGFQLKTKIVFDNLTVLASDQTPAISQRALERQVNLRYSSGGEIGVALDETTTLADIDRLFDIFAGESARNFSAASLCAELEKNNFSLPKSWLRTTSYLQHEVFNSYHSETEMLRYITSLQSQDLTLANSMIPLGSCTMKLNATAEMIPVTWPEFARLHPFAPLDQVRGTLQLIGALEERLAAITGFARISLQPNAGSQGEYCGLLVIRAYHEARRQGERKVCLIPSSAHGTNPASAAMAGMQVVVVECDERGNVSISDLKQKCLKHADQLAALMITYPSTHGVFEEGIIEICETVHAHGGLVYMDGANLNALVGLCRPADLGVDVCHMNLHKTFCIPHGGGGPGAGPIGVVERLQAFLPTHSVVPEAGPARGTTAVSSAPWGSAGILPISYAYITMMGAAGLKRASQVAILNANYIAHRLSEHFPVVYRGPSGLIAHECILDIRGFEASSHVKVEDVAKRLIDYGFHAPTMSWPVIGTLMVEPTESESKAELDRFCDAMIGIRHEIQEIEAGLADRENNVLKNAPHTIAMATADEWKLPYSRAKAVYPLPGLRRQKFWAPVGRVNNAHGDRNLVCSCPPLDAYRE